MGQKNIHYYYETAAATTTTTTHPKRLLTFKSCP